MGTILRHQTQVWERTRGALWVGEEAPTKCGWRRSQPQGSYVGEGEDRCQVWEGREDKGKCGRGGRIRGNVREEEGKLGGEGKWKM